MTIAMLGKAYAADNRRRDEYFKSTADKSRPWLPPQSRPPCMPGNRSTALTGAYQAKAAVETAWLRAIREQSEPEPKQVLVSGWPVRKLVGAT